MKAATNRGIQILSAVVAVILLAVSAQARTHYSSRSDVTINRTVIDFGTVTTSTRSSWTSVTLTNNNWRDASLNASVWPAQFSYNGASTFTVKAHQSVTVGVFFLPTLAQAYRGRLSFSTSGGTTLSVSLSGSGAAGQSTTMPAITSQPANRTVTAGQTASFTVSVTGTAPLSYQWKKNGAAIGGATSSSYTTPVTTTSDNGAQFTCTVSNAAGNLTSNTAALTVNAATTIPAITSQPANRTVTAGQTASFTVSVTGTAPLSYQWKKNGAAIGGATSSSYTTPVTTTSDNGAQFTCTVSNAAGNITSNAAALTVNAAATAPSIVSQPANRTVTAGQTASFTVSVTGTAPLSYQWMKNGAAIGGATSSSYTTPVTATSDNGAQFTCTVSNAAGNLTSNPATLTVNAATLLLSVNPSSVSFGSVNMGSSASQQATLTNTGSGNVTLSGLAVSGAGFSASGASSGQVLLPGQTATLNISFQPPAAGNASGSVTVSSNAAAIAITLSASGAQQVAHSVSLSWTRSTSTVAGYQVYSSQVSGGPYTRLNGSTVNLPNYTDSSVQNGKTYYYVVTAVDASGMESSYSNQASALVQ